MNWADVVIGIVVVLSVLLAAAQGFFLEIFSLAGTVFGYLAAAWGYARLAPTEIRMQFHSGMDALEAARQGRPAAATDKNSAAKPSAPAGR